MGRGKKYTEDYKEMISDLYKSGMTISEISSEYGIAKSTINGWVKANKEIKISEDEVITLKEMARIKEENEILKKAM
ncbi:transposase, partial [Clostridium perfringens]